MIIRGISNVDVNHLVVRATKQVSETHTYKKNISEEKSIGVLHGKGEYNLESFDKNFSISQNKNFLKKWFITSWINKQQKKSMRTTGLQAHAQF